LLQNKNNLTVLTLGKNPERKSMFQPPIFEKRSIWVDLVLGAVPAALTIVLQKVVEELGERIRRKREKEEILEDGIFVSPTGEKFFLVPVDSVEMVEEEPKPKKKTNKKVEKTNGENRRK
jgi:hypothetical protein